MATVQLRTPTEGRAYFDRKKAARKTSMEAMRCLKPRLSYLVYRTMLGDYTASKVTSPEGNGATTLTPTRPAHNPTPALRTSHFRTRQHQAYDHPAPGLLTQKGAM